MDNPKAYMIATYYDNDPDFLDGVVMGDLVICMKPTEENIALAKTLYLTQITPPSNHDQKTYEQSRNHQSGCGHGVQRNPKGDCG
jgi:hypothetical protein